jgi:hypothetical protein
MAYTVEKHRGLWWVIDDEGYEARSVGYDFKYEALASARLCEAEDKIESQKKAAFINRVLAR